MSYLDPGMILERQEKELYEAFERGEISNQKLQDELRSLHREYREMAEEAAHEAYRNEIDRW